MSNEVYKNLDTNLEKKKNLFNAEVLDFPIDKKMINTKEFKINNQNSWKLYDGLNKKEDGDQLKTVIGICFMFGALIVIGLYSNFV